MDPFLSLQLTISQNLVEDEISAMKSVCQHITGKSKMESVKIGMELFSILMEQQIITKDNVVFLEEMLKIIKRNDLVSLVKQFVEEGQVTEPEDQPDPNEKPFEVICDNVGRDWRMLMRKLDVSDVMLARIEAAHPYNMREQLYQSLREWQKLKRREAKVEDLIKTLRSCDMNLAADLVE
ncbi:FADD protein, partial [Rhinopomastus cyanomelas]|nr:FADD protein [Rhinopomastus cyanomelas]